MTKFSNSFIKIISIFAAIVIIAINLYAIANRSATFPISTTTNVLFVIIFTLLSIKNIKDKNKFGYLYLAFALLIAVIFLLRLL